MTKNSQSSPDLVERLNRCCCDAHCLHTVESVSGSFRAKREKFFKLFSIGMEIKSSGSPDESLLGSILLPTTIVLVDRYAVPYPSSEIEEEKSLSSLISACLLFHYLNECKRKIFSLSLAFFFFLSFFPSAPAAACPSNKDKKRLS